MVAAIRTSAAHFPPAGLHALLRERTRELHRRLDSSPYLLALMRPGLDMQAYAGILQRLVLAYARIEPLLCELQACRPLQLPVYQPRLPALLADLAHLPAPDALPELPPMKPPPVSDETAHYFGMRYVVEGSTQGARMISSRLEKNLPQLSGEAFAYWGVQHEAAAGWPFFLDCLDQAKVEAEALVRGADAAFAAFLDVFDAALSAS